MKFNWLSSRVTPLLLGACLATQAATTNSWFLNTDGNWNDPANWDPEGVPNGVSSMAILTNGLATTTFVTNDTSVTLGSLWIGPANTANSFTITNEFPENNLVFDNGGNGAELIQLIPASSSGYDRIYPPVVLADNLLITNVGPKYVALHGEITEINGPKSITKAGNGNLQLASTANTFSGGVVVKAGGLTAAGNRAGTGPITIGNISGTDNVQVFGSGTYTNAIIVAAGSTGTKTIRAAGTSANVTFSGPIQLDGTLTVHGQTSTRHNSVSGPISGDGAIRVTGSTSGTTPPYSTLSGANSFAGGVTLESGNFRAGTDTALGTGTFTLKSGTFAAGGTGTRNFANDVVISGNIRFGAIEGTTSTGTLILGGLTDLGNTTRTLTVSNTTYFTNIVSGDAGITKRGKGTFILRDHNTFTGPVTIQEGILQAYPFSNYDPLGATPAVPTTNLLVFDGGTLTAGRAFFVHGNRGGYITENNGTIGGNLAIGVSGGLDGPGSLTKTGTSRLSLGGSSTFSGGLIFDQGKLRIGNNQALGTGTFTIADGTSVVNYYNTVRTLTNAVVLNGNFTFGSMASDEFGTMIFSGPWDIGASTRTITVPEENGSNVVSVISGSISGAGGITKDGLGTLTLSGANTYGGPTTLSQGELTLSTAGVYVGGITAYDQSVLGVIRDEASPKLVTPSLALAPASVGMTTAFFLPSGASATPVIETTDLAINGQIEVQIYGGGFTVGQFPLIKYTTLTGGGTFATAPLYLPAGLNAEIVNNTANSSIDLKVNSATPAALTWTGAFNSPWDFSILNWADANGPATFAQGASVTIDDTALWPTLILGGVMQPSSVLVNNTATNITIGGAGSLDGTMTLTKTGTNILTISSANTYSGGTVVNEGALRVFNLTGSATGSGAVSISTGAALLGNGFIAGPVTVSSGAAVAIGTTALGTLTVNNSLSLASGSTTFLRLDKAAATNDMIVAGNTAFGGTLTVTNISGELAGGETFQLFSTTGQTGNFSDVIVLGSTATGQFDPGTGLLTITGGMATYPTNISFSFTSGELSLTWPETHKGWLAQSNSVDIADTASWFPIPGSDAGTNLTITVDPATPKVFYRLVKP